MEVRGTAKTALTLAAPLGPAGLFLLLSRLLPETPSPFYIPWNAEAAATLAIWAAGAVLFYIVAVWQNASQFFGRPGRAGARAWIPHLLVMLVGHLLALVLLGGAVSAILLLPSAFLVGGVSWLANSHTGTYPHRVVADLLLLYSLAGCALAAVLLFRGSSWKRRPLRISLLGALIVGCLSMATLASLARLAPDRLHRLYNPTVER